METVELKEEFRDAELRDHRLTLRLISLAENFSEHPEGHIPEAMQSRMETKAAYRFFQNEKVTAEGILSSHRGQTLQRMSEHERVYLVEDTSSLNFNSHAATKGLGNIGRRNKSSSMALGLQVHSTMAYTPSGVALGLVHQKIWSRKNLDLKDQELESFIESENNKWLLAMKRLVSEELPLATQIIHVCDRESDCSAYLYHASENGLDFVIRAKSNRIIGDKYKRRVIDHLESLPELGRFKLETTNRPHEPGSRTRYLKSEREILEMQVFGSRVKLNIKDSKNNYIEVTAVWVKPVGSDKTDFQWLLLTPLPAETLDQALGIVEIYKCRWSIEIFHKVLKSGFKIEECRLGNASRLMPYVTLISIVAWRLQFILKLGREEPELPSSLVLTEDEWKVVYMHGHRQKVTPKTPPPLGESVRHIAEMGGFIGRKNQVPGPITFWRGMRRLDAMVEFYQQCVKTEKDVGS